MIPGVPDHDRVPLLLSSSAPSPLSPATWMRGSRRPSWLSPKVLRTEVLAGLVVALALIPEAISF